MTRSRRILELRCVRGTGGGPDKTILLSAAPRYAPRYETFVCYIRNPDDPLYALDRRGLEEGVAVLEVAERSALDWRVWPQLRELVRRLDIGLVHAHDYKTDMLALLLARRDRIIPLSTAHGWSGHSWRETRIYYPLDRWLLARYPKVIAVSSDMREALVAAGADPQKVTVVLNGIDPARFMRDSARAAEARRRFDVPDGWQAVGAVGRLESEKNFGCLVDAFRQLADQQPHTLLLIAGEGSLRPQLAAQIAAAGVGDRCRLLGQVSDVIEFHHALDLFVQSSDNEGTPNAVLEAMALRTPIVATGVGGTAELARDRREALIVPRRDSRALAAAMAEALTLPADAAARAAAGRGRVVTDLSFAARLRRIERIYDELFDAHPR